MVNWYGVALGIGIWLASMIIPSIISRLRSNPLRTSEIQRLRSDLIAHLYASNYGSAGIVIGAISAML